MEEREVGGEGGVIPELEEELKEVQMEIERIERDPLGYASGLGLTYNDTGEDGGDTGISVVDDGDGWDHWFWVYLTLVLTVSSIELSWQ